MPRVAFERGAVMRQHPLARMADAILDACDVEIKAQPRDARLSRMADVGHRSETLLRS
jgi:hypothetical protein